jgi:hypothetical protein|nr:MAG TPA: hypothetical protein [Caudoviricetes sp.]
MNPNPRLTPAARRLRTEIICRYSTMFTRARPYRDLNPAAPLALDPRGDAAHLTQSVRDEAPADADAVLARVVASLPARTMDDLNVSREALLGALIASRPYQPVYA